MTDVKLLWRFGHKAAAERRQRARVGAKEGYIRIPALLNPVALAALSFTFFLLTVYIPKNS
jgi:hypothetical protein